MFSFHFGPLTRQSRAVFTLVLALAAGGVLVGPAFATLASSPPAAVLDPAHEVPLTIPVIRVKTFVNLGDEGCIPGPPLHEGPSFVTGKLRHEGLLWRRVGSAMWRCLEGWHGELALSVSVDKTGNIVDVRAHTADGRMRACVIGRIFEEGRGDTYGPGTLNVSYFLPASRGP